MGSQLSNMGTHPFALITTSPHTHPLPTNLWPPLAQGKGKPSPKQKRNRKFVWLVASKASGGQVDSLQGYLWLSTVFIVLTPTIIFSFISLNIVNICTLHSSCDNSQNWIFAGSKKILLLLLTQDIYDFFFFLGIHFPWNFNSKKLLVPRFSFRGVKFASAI